MTYESVLYHCEDGVATITLNRPDRLNAWTGTMERELRSAIEAGEADPLARAIVITGAGRGFCAGADMDVLSAATEPQSQAQTQQIKHGKSKSSGDTSIEANFEKRFSYLLRTKKPIIAAINGPIAGIGLCMSLFCDLRYMSDTAKLTTAFARRGLIAEHGISWMLPRLVGPMNALDLLFSARVVQAAEAERLGLVRVLPSEGFLAKVQATASELGRLSSPRSIGIIKRQVYESLFQSMAEAWEIADEEMVKSFVSEDFKEGVAHFIEKRAPAFTGK